MGTISASNPVEHKSNFEHKSRDFISCITVLHVHVWSVLNDDDIHFVF